MSHPLGVHGPALREGPGRAPVRGRVRASGQTSRGGGALRLPIAVGLMVSAATTYLGLTDPYRPGAHLACPVLALTGYYCAGCGGQRAVHELARLDLAGAWGMNPLVVLAAPVAVVGWARWLQRCRRHGPPGPLARSTLLPWIVVGVVVAFAVLRNVPVLAPWLAP